MVDGARLYQIKGNASTPQGYATRPDGALHEITRVRIPYNSPQGLAGFRVPQLTAARRLCLIYCPKEGDSR